MLGWVKRYSSSCTRLRATGRHLPHGVTSVLSVNAPCQTPARKAGTRFTYPGGMEGWVDLGGLHTEMMHLPQLTQGLRATTPSTPVFYPNQHPFPLPVSRKPSSGVIDSKDVMYEYVCKALCALHAWTIPVFRISLSARIISVYGIPINTAGWSRTAEHPKNYWHRKAWHRKVVVS